VPHFAVSAIGRDRPGIVAAIAKVLLEHQANIEDSDMTILRGHFTMMLVLSIPDGADVEELRAGLQEAGQELGLEAVSLSEVADLDVSGGRAPSHIVTVYGVDHPGIVHAVSSAMAGREVNVTDVATRLVEGDERLYAMMMEVALPPDLAIEDLDAALQEVGREQGVEVTVRALEQDAL
jgi:glycine cleavage system transcriptional repressor